METIFFACFAFGALFILLSAALGALHTAIPGADVGHFGHLHLHAPYAPHVPHATVPGAHGAPASHAAGGANGQHAGAPANDGGWHVFNAVRPLLNVASLLAFLTWFGAAGYLALHFAAWPLELVLAVAVLVGLAGGALVGAFMRKLLAGEQVLNPDDYRLEGTLAKVTITVPAAGTGEIVFSKAGARRSEAARSVNGDAIARGTEVVILGYERGIARVQPWQELLNTHPPPELPNAITLSVSDVVPPQRHRVETPAPHRS